MLAFFPMVQVPTVPTTIRQIMSHQLFEIGVRDAGTRRPFNKNYDCWDGDEQWSYDRGRQWFAAVPPSIPLKRDGRIIAEAEDWYARCATCESKPPLNPSEPSKHAIYRSAQGLPSLGR